MLKKVLIGFALWMMFGAVLGQDKKNQWIDSAFNTLSTSEKVAQLLVVPISSYSTEGQTKDLVEEINDYHPGGIVILKGGPHGTTKLINQLQKDSPIPLLVMMDAENGPGKTLDSLINFPQPLSLEAINNDSLIFLFESEIARELKLLGVHMNIGPSKKELPIKGLTMSDVSNFPDISAKSKGESEKKAFEAGYDLLVNPTHIKAAIKKIETAVKRNAALKLQLDNSIRKILGVKYDQGLLQTPRLNTDNLIGRINTPSAKALNFELSEASITIAKNKASLIPIKVLDEKKFAAINIGSGNTTSFNTYLNKYTAFDLFNVAAAKDTIQLKELNSYDAIVVGIFDINPTEQKKIISWLNNTIKNTKTIICSFGNSNDLIGLVEPETLIMAYTDEMPVPMLTAQIIFGARQGKGITPIAINGLFAQGEGNTNQTLDRLSYGLPELVGMDSETLERINAIVAQAIDSGATPGCNVLVARNGQVVFDKSYGWKTYEKQEPVTWQTIYDLASITKVAATLQTVMFMQERGLIDVNKKVSVYLPELKTTNKKDFTIKDIITHQAGLWPYLPYWLQTMKDSTLLPEYYNSSQNAEYPFPVSKDLFAVKTMRDSMWQWIINAKIREKKPRTPYDYTYSDMGFYIMQHVAEKLLNQPIQDFLTQNLYEPLGATTTGFLPLERFPESQIAPTEVDKQFRHSKLVGYVHDQGAAMFGGIAGHAGLFSSANDLAKLGQMWLQKGSYGGQKFYKPETLDLFTAKQYETSRRGLGWDKPTVSDWNGPTSLYASPKTFGHTGFTGTAVWVDPEFNLVYIFLSNRVYPDMFNNKLLTGNIRPRIQDVIYQSIFDYCKGQN